MNCHPTLSIGLDLNQVDTFLELKSRNCLSVIFGSFSVGYGVGARRIDDHSSDMLPGSLCDKETRNHSRLVNNVLKSSQAD